MSEMPMCSECGTQLVAAGGPSIQGGGGPQIVGAPKHQLASCPNPECATNKREEAEAAEPETDPIYDSAAEVEPVEQQSITCEECGFPLEFAVGDTIVDEQSWAEGGHAAIVGTLQRCTNRDCPTRNLDGGLAPNRAVGEPAPYDQHSD